MCDSCSQAGPSRRSLLLGGAALATIPLVGNVAQAQPVSAADTPDAALKLMTEGNERYVANSAARTGFLRGTREPGTWSGSLCCNFELRRIPEFTSAGI